jgi:hypothetical protein
MPKMTVVRFAQDDHELFWVLEDWPQQMVEAGQSDRV